MRDAARLLIVEGDRLRPVLERTPRAAFDLATVCTGWSVRDVLAHCGAALTRTASDDLHAFSPEDNEADVELRRTWALGDVLEELFEGYPAAARAIDRAGGRLDAIGLGEWIHGGDVREPLGEPDAYVSPGVELAVPLLVERSRRRFSFRIEATVDSERLTLGTGEPGATLQCDLETFVRLCGGRQPDPTRFRLVGAEPNHLALFD